MGAPFGLLPYAMIVRSRGEVQELIPLHPDRVAVTQGDDLALSFLYTRADGQRVSLEQDEVLHLVGLTLDGVHGVSAIAYARETIGLALAMEDHGATTFRNGARVVGEIPACVIGIEACTGAYFWQRQFEAFGHEVRIIAPQHVKPFGRRQKNDRNDAEAIAIAITQPRMRFVPKKSVTQQDIQSLHRARRRMVNHRTALVNQMRGILLDRGIAFGQSITRARRMIPEIINDASKRSDGPLS